MPRHQVVAGKTPEATDVKSFVTELMGSNPYDAFDASGYTLDVVINIDTQHGEDEVSRDIRRCFELLRPGGTMFGDDYAAEEPGVIKAVNRFAADHGLCLSVAREKWAVQKPAS
ncbi:MAG TPA: hypothetical protein VEN29_09110 [Casimicrobiaceae bacterium]|nr:hypothetical protein [Casimicrobiaceae bacterium]